MKLKVIATHASINSVPVINVVTIPYLIKERNAKRFKLNLLNVVSTVDSITRASVNGVDRITKDR